tara:strand:- start:4207 stop:5070 length:864 start_codon:yes stop_codon:yes gene_type:complete
MKPLFTTSFISPTALSLNARKNKISNIKMFENPFPGSEIGIPLNIFQDIFTNLHYGENIIGINDILLQFCIGYFAYGYDRYIDSLDSKEEDLLSERKKKLYKYIKSNQEIILISLFTCYSYIIYSLSQEITTIPFIFLLLSTFQYKNIKTNIGEFKAMYIALLWVTSSVFIPSIKHDHDYSILFYPQDYLPGILTLFSSSNYADTLDIKEDKADNIYTLPVKYGLETSNFISILSLLFSTFLFGINPNFSNRIIPNSLFELQNIGLIYFILTKTESDEIEDETNIMN